MNAIGVHRGPTSTDASLEPLPEEVRDTAHFVRSEVGPSAVFAGDAVASRWMSALAGSRVLIARDFAAPRDWGARIDLNSAGLFGRHVLNCADDHSGIGLHQRAEPLL